VSKEFALVRPCAKCPFRTDVPGYLRRARAVEIAESLAGGAPFLCHETTVDADDDEGTLVEGPNTSYCAGSMIVLEKEEAPNQMMRTAERIGLYDRERLDMDAPVVRSLAAFVAHHGVDEEEQEPCSVCGPDCLAPAGHLIDGMVVPAVAEGELEWCPSCGEPVCENCMDGSLCLACSGGDY
jgi:hypothetical protein